MTTTTTGPFTTNEVEKLILDGDWPVYGVNNHAPVVTNAISNQLLVAGSSINYQFPINTFSDQDVGDVLTFTTSALPGWLTFTPSTRTFSGTTPSVLGVTTVTVTATDLYGFTANSIFTITHDNAPIAANVIPNQTGNNNTVFSFQFNSNTFTDPDLETLTYSATGMPTGIIFTSSTRTFSGTPTVVSSSTVTVTATDPGGLSITSAFVITVAAGPTTLNPADQDDVTLSGGNLTATSTRCGFVRTVNSATTGKFYYEMKGLAGTYPSTGVATAGSALMGGFFGEDAKSAGIELDFDGNVICTYGFVVNNGAILGMRSLVNDVFGIAVDVDARKFWVKNVTQASAWNKGGSDNPTTGVTIYTFTFAFGGAIFSGFAGYLAGDSAVFNFGATAYTGTPPSGFGNLI